MEFANDRTRRKLRADTRLAHPIPVVESTNNALTFSADNDRRRTEMSATPRPCRIQWTRALDADLVRCNDAILLPRGSGRQRQLVRCWLELHPMLPASGAALSTRLCRIRQLGAACPPVQAASRPGSDRDSSGSSTAGDFWRSRAGTRSRNHPGGAAVELGSIWEESSLSSLDLCPQRQELSEHRPQGEPGSDTSSSDGEWATERGTATTGARRVEISSTLRWTHRMQDGEELDGSLSEESDEESPPCRPGRDRQSPSLEADDPVIGTGLDRGPNTEGTTAGSEELDGSSDELRKEFLSVLGTVEAGEEGGLSERGRPSCKGLLVPHQLVRSVDDLIVEKYEEGEQSLWKLNCLVYAGAQVVSDRVKRNLARMTRKRPSQKRKEADVAQLRQQIGWLEAEIHRRKSGKRPTPRQWRNIRLLHAEHTGLRELEVSLETRKAKLRVRAAQLRRVPSLTPPTAGMVRLACTRGRGVGLMASNTHLRMRFPSSGRA